MQGGVSGVILPSNSIHTKSVTGLMGPCDDEWGTASGQAQRISNLTLNCVRSAVSETMNRELAGAISSN